MNGVNFDRVASSYDFLAGIVFGRTLMDSQIEYLDKLPEYGKILIIGGGTGKVLEYINRPKLEIHFIEKSKNMLSRAKRRNSNIKKIIFIHGDENLIDKQYDAILTFYFLDVFEKSFLKKVINKLYSSLKDEGLWLVADFQQSSNVFNLILLKFMYLFFRMTTRLSVNKLYDFEQLLVDQGLVLMDKRIYYRGLIQSLLLTKTS